LGIDANRAKDGFARNRALAKQDLGPGSRGKIDVDPASEPDEPDPLASLNPIAFLDEGHDPPCDKAGNLGEADL
jgi:hypothetical protein